MFDSVQKAFSLQSEIFDEYEKGNEILKWMRSVTHKHVLRHLRESDRILELNSGTGIDAVFLAKNGFRIHCTDISEGMLNKLNKKITEFKLQDLVTSQQLSFIHLDKLYGYSFDYIFSNFGGLNCTENLSDVFKHFSKILNPGGKVTLVIIPPICPWEIASFIKGNFSTAFRRLHKNGVTATIEGVKFTTYYHSVVRTIKALGPNFSIKEIQGLASISPPPYMTNFSKRFPGLYKILTRIDENLSHIFPFNRWADHFIITAEFNPN
ncbi:MAG: class I SAM-dependent methyltransferase [Melioribacter sp.]|nr:class I SAM-dependent methyltransferase [Melioribacter sp.]